MSVSTAQVNVGTSPVQFKPDTRSMPSAASLLVYNRGSVAIYVGGPNVTVNNGFQIDPDQPMSLPIASAGDRVFAVTASGSTICHLFQSDSYA